MSTNAAFTPTIILANPKHENEIRITPSEASREKIPLLEPLYNPDDDILGEDFYLTTRERVWSAVSFVVFAGITLAAAII